MKLAQQDILLQDKTRSLCVEEERSKTLSQELSALKESLTELENQLSEEKVSLQHANQLLSNEKHQTESLQ